MEVNLQVLVDMLAEGKISTKEFNHICNTLANTNERLHNQSDND